MSVAINKMTIWNLTCEAVGFAKVPRVGWAQHCTDGQQDGFCEHGRCGRYGGYVSGELQFLETASRVL